MARVNRRDQWCYVVNVDGISHMLHIVTKNFHVNVPPAIVFDTERQQINATIPPQAVDNNELCSLQENVKANVNTQLMAAKEIAELCFQGIEVDNNNVPTQQINGNWIVPTIWPQQADANITNSEGKWKLSLWKAIVEKSKIELFQMAFPEKFIVDVAISAANNKLEKPMTLQEFYTWLGCQFFMACFEGVTDRKDWWSGKPILKQSGAPFQLNEYFKKSHFLQITSAITYTDKDPPAFVD